MDHYVSAISVATSLEQLHIGTARGRYKTTDMLCIRLIVRLVAQVNVVVFNHDLVLRSDLLLRCIGVHYDSRWGWLGRDADASFFVGCAAGCLGFGFRMVSTGSLLSWCVSRLLLLCVLESTLLVGIALVERWILDFRMSLTQGSALSPCRSNRLLFVLSLLLLILEVVRFVII